MRKIISLIIIALLLVSTIQIAEGASADQISVVVNDQQQTVVIGGNLALRNKRISMKVLRPDVAANTTPADFFKEVAFTGQTISNQEGSFTFPAFKIVKHPSQQNATGTYTLIVNAEGLETKISKTFDFFDISELSEYVIEIVQASTAAQAKAAIEARASRLTLNMALYNSVINSEKIAEYITEIYKTVTIDSNNVVGQFKTIFNECSLMQRINETNTYDNLYSLIDSHDDIIKAKGTAVWKIYTDRLTGDGQRAALSADQKPQYNKLSTYKEALFDQIVVTAANGIANWTDIYQMITILSQDITVFDYNKYNNLANRRAVDEILASNTYTTAEAFYQAVKYNTDNPPAIQEPSASPKGKGGGGGSGGDSTYTMPLLTNDMAADLSSQNIFTDVGDNMWAKRYIEVLYKKGVINGYEGNIFDPDKSITREEFLKIIVKAFNMDITSSAKVFQDVKEGEWYGPYIDTAFKMGIVQGMNENVFGVGEKISRQDMVAILGRAIEKMNVKLYESKENTLFTDEGDIADYAKSAIAMFYRADIISGAGDGSFAPNSTATRAEVSKVIWEILSRTEGEQK